jgi:hypothetical protein
MKLHFFLMVFALVTPLAACNSNNSVASNTTQSPKTQSSPIIPVSIPQAWYDYTAKDGTYTAKFPRQPKEKNNSDKSTMGELKSVQVMYEDKAKNRVYLTQSNKYPVDPSQYNAEKGLDGARDAQTKNGRTIESEKKITLNGLPGRELIIKNKDHVQMKARVFIDPNGPTMIMALVGAGNGNVNFPEAETFLDSLTVPKK